MNHKLIERRKLVQNVYKFKHCLLEKVTKKELCKKLKF